MFGKLTICYFCCAIFKIREVFFVTCNINACYALTFVNQGIIPLPCSPNNHYWSLFEAKVVPLLLMSFVSTNFSDVFSQEAVLTYPVAPCRLAA